ncbi:uncharacterized protein N7477_006605 [Penicillium maclennaniae]|uniref:uncharacterized protein n=1 Tax=Penicillium maclennaniae TaxID=1343394 RepID=UPI00253FEA52|nr:uncharacterized protein N7477_006605 [Penicillium maclennaniae]KAJ5668035.1 hypothetical protein N7477_006605 [Penicillium maclennaniae]
MFFQGSLQDGIALAVREAKAVVCFVRDDEQLSSTWEEEYLTGDEVAPVLDAKAVILRLAAGTQEAGFLTTFCPIAKFPTVVVIKNGTLQEYLTPEVSKDELKRRLIAVLEGGRDILKTQQSQQSSPVPTNSNTTTMANSNADAPVTSIASNTPSRQQARHCPSDSQIFAQHPSQASTRMSGPSAQKPSEKSEPLKQQPLKDSPREKSKGKQPAAPVQKSQMKANKKPPPAVEEPKRQIPVPRGPPSQYRLQTIRGDVRPWLDGEMGDDNRPYNLKHILTPLPNRTLSVAEESQTLQELSLGSTATLVMLTRQLAHCPRGGISAVYNVVSGVASTATGIVGSILGYGSSAPASEVQPAPPPPGQHAQRPRPTGMNIRTLRDQQTERGDSQFYNGNQLNFEPRNKEDKDN